MRFRNQIFGILSCVIAGLFLDVFKETSWAIFVERILEEAAKDMHIPRAAMIATLSQILLFGGVFWAALYFAFRVGRAERPPKPDEAIEAARAHTEAIRAQTEALRASKSTAESAVIPKFDPAWKPDIPLLDAPWRVTLGKWDARVKYPENDYEALKPFWDALIGIRQKAFEGKLPIWARRIMRPPSTLLEVVPPQFWINHDFSPSFCRPSDHEAWILVTHELLVGETRGARTNVWEGFMTSRAAIEKLWPAKS